MNGVMQDVRYAVRALARSPGFAAAAIVSLAIGVGANTSIFSVASALLLRPLPYPHADRLVILWNPADPVTFAAVSLLLMAVAFVASYIPARRAARIDPMISLRTE